MVIRGPPRRARRKLSFAAGRLGRAADLGEDFVFLQDHVLLVVDLDVVAAVLAEQDAVARFNVQRDTVTLLVQLSGCLLYTSFRQGNQFHL